MKISYSIGDYKQLSGKRTAPVLFWRGVIAAVAWAAKHSPEVRADLAEILRDCEPSET